MYIAQINGRYWVKRMPETGTKHKMGCSSWEIPEQFSGRSDLINGAGVIYEDNEVKLRLDFALSRRGNQAPPPVAEPNNDKPSAKAEGKRLTLRSLLHFLWDEAGLSKWPGNGEKRNWAYVYESLNEAMIQKTVKHGELQSFIYMPEPCEGDHREEAIGRRRKRFAQTGCKESGNSHQLLMFIGGVTKFQRAGTDYRALLSNLPDCPFIVEEKLYERIQQTFSGEIRMNTGKEPGHLMMIGTFSVSPEGIPLLEEVSLMYVSEEWLPFDNIYEHAVISKLVSEDRTFLKVLRYNRRVGTRMPSFLLADTGDEPTALYVIDSQSTVKAKQVEAVAKASSYSSWIYDAKLEEAMPGLPDKRLQEIEESSVVTFTLQQGEPAFDREMPCPEDSKQPADLPNQTEQNAVQTVATATPLQAEAFFQSELPIPAILSTR
jgi:hypothetical protein